jgi:hypothetical protein
MNCSWKNAYSDAVHSFKGCDFFTLHTKITLLDNDEEEEKKKKGKRSGGRKKKENGKIPGC